MKTEWNNVEKKVLTTLLDVIIPSNPDKNIPGAGLIGVIDFLAKESASDLSLARDLRSLISQAKNLEDIGSPSCVRIIEKDQPEAFSRFVRATYMGYYSRPDIRSLLGLSGQPVHPQGYLVSPETQQQMFDLTSMVRERGKVYRDPMPHPSRILV